MILRRATIHDKDRLFAWRNDPETFKYFRNPHPVTREQHDAWFERNVFHKCHQIWIAEDSQLFTMAPEPCGNVRFDNRDGDNWEIAIAVAPDFRGKGFGSEMLARAVAIKPESILIAEIAAENKASIRIFEKCGFVKITPHNLPFMLWRRKP